MICKEACESYIVSFGVRTAWAKLRAWGEDLHEFFSFLPSECALERPVVGDGLGPERTQESFARSLERPVVWAWGGAQSVIPSLCLQPQVLYTP